VRNVGTGSLQVSRHRSGVQKSPRDNVLGGKIEAFATLKKRDHSYKELKPLDD